MKDSIDWDSLADASELDDFLSPEELSEIDVMRLERQSLGQELEDLALRMLRTLDRVRLYGEAIDPDEFDFLHREVLRLRKLFA